MIVLTLLRNIFGMNAVTGSVEPGSAVALEAKPAPVVDQPGAVDDDRSDVEITSFLGREAILDREERIVGYEFSLNARMRSRIQDVRERVQKVYDDALLRNLSGLKVDSLLGDRLAFVRLSPMSLDNPLILSLPRRQTVLMISPTQQGFDVEQTAANLANLFAAGFRHGWVLRRQQMETNSDLLQLALSGDFAEIKTGSFDGVEIGSLARQLRSSGSSLAVSGQRTEPIRLIARELPTYDDFNLCYKAGFDYFHGPFITSGEDWRPPESDLDRMRLFEILGLVRSDASFKLIADHLKREPVLSFKLLRYLNSAAAGLQREIDNIGQALTILGRERFFRWLSLLFFDLSNPGYRERMLTEQALVRGRFLESLAGAGRIPADRDQLFMLGVFSQLDLLLGRPLAEILDQAKLPSALAGALMGEAGPWRDALELAIAAQEVQPEAMEAAATRCQVDGRQVSHSTLDALAWASALDGAVSGLRR